MIRLAVTGSSGYLGQAVLRALEADPEVERVLALDMLPSPESDKVHCGIAGPQLNSPFVKALRRATFLPLPENCRGLAQFIHEDDAAPMAVLLAKRKARGTFNQDYQKGTESVSRHRNLLFVITLQRCVAYVSVPALSRPVRT